MTDFEAIHEISQLKYRYLRAFDTKDWELFESCFAPDATAAYGGLDFNNVADLMAYMHQNVRPGMHTMHHVHHPEIEVDGDTATGTWYLTDKVMIPRFNYALEGTALYADRYRRTGDGWKLAHTGYDRIWEASWKIDEVPSWKIEGIADRK